MFMGLFAMVMAYWQLGDCYYLADFNEVRKQRKGYGFCGKRSLEQMLLHVYFKCRFEEIHLGGSSFSGVTNRHLKMKGFDDFVKTTWKEAQVNDHNDMRKFMNKLKLLKGKIREWTKDKRANTNNNKKILKEQLAEIDSLLDKGKGNVETLNNRADIFNSLHDIDKLESIELAQKAKIKWGIEGDENTKYYHGILNRTTENQLAFRGVD
ncbi:hypothetical protein Tco_0561943 [Tanacetum coccineum]